MNKNLEIVNERAKILERPSKIKQCNNLQRDLSTAVSRSVDSDRCGQTLSPRSSGFWYLTLLVLK